jgi:ABC-type Fe3+-siderophore transport system permease subunit
MRRLTVLLGLCGLLLSSAAHAEKKDPKKAKIMSGAAAAVSGGVVLTGFMLQKDGDPFNAPVLYTGLGLLAITPSLGEFYSEQYLTIGMGVRAAAAGFAVYVLNKYTRLAKCPLAPASDPPECNIFTEGAYPLLGVAAIAFIGGVWYDVLDAGDAAERYNRKHGFSVVPAAMPGPQGTAPGLIVTGTF